MATRRKALIRLAALALVALLAAPHAARAHALLERSAPAPGGVVPADRPPSRISLWFTEPIEVDANALAVLNTDHRRVDGLNARASPGDPNRVDVDLAPGELPQGAYLARWRVTSADGHVVRGSHWFVVGFAATPPPSAALLGSGAPRLPPIEVAARWLGLLSLMVLAGAPLFRLLVLRPAGVEARRSEGTVWLATTAGFVLAHCLRAAAQAEAVAELPLPGALTAPVLTEVFLRSRFALLWWPQFALGLGLGAVLYFKRGSSATWLAALLGLGLLIATSLGSHSVGARFAPALAVAVDAAHLAAAALWLGGLVELSLLLPALVGGEKSDALRVLVPRVSAVFIAAVLLLVATGIFNTWEQVASIAGALTTAYGQSLLLKLGVLAVLLSIAAVNLLVIRPRIVAGGASETPRRLLANVRAEILFAAILLLGVALLTTLPPPAQQPLPAPMETARQAGDLRVVLRVDPVWVGVSRFKVMLASELGRAAEARQVVLTFTMEGMNMGRTNVTLAPRGAGVYEAEGFYVGMPGIAQIGVAINRPEGDRAAVFRIEVPDVNPKQFVGLPAAFGFGSGFPGVGDAPVPADAASLGRGRQLYDAHCAMCHGATGIGNGPSAPSLLPPPADLTLHARWHADEQLHWFIAHGVPGTSMLGFADRLGATDRWDVVRHLHELARAPTATALRPAPVAPAQVAAPPAPAASTQLMAPPAQDAAASLAGRLVYGPDYDNNLWLLRLPDGKPQPLTKFGPKEFSSNPAWSHDGRQIAFSYYRLPEEGPYPVPDGTDLYVMNADGSGMRLVAKHDESGVALQYPAWSAGGTAVYVTYSAPGGIGPSVERVSVKTGARTRVVAEAAYPALSRDGRSLAYVRYAAPPERGESLWLGAPDGSRARAVIGPAAFTKYFGLRFSPDGRRLVFAAVGQPASLGLIERALGIRPAYANGDLWDLWSVDINGRNLRPLTAISEDLPVAAWSPDGRRVAFLGGGSASSAEAGLALLVPGNKELRRLTTQPGHRGVDWTRN